MGAPIKPRKSAKRAPRRATTPNPNHPFRRLWNDPETRPMMLERARRGAKKAGRPAGVADGYTKQQIDALRPQAEVRAERIITAMATEDEELQLDDVSLAEAEQLVDDDKASARRALKEAITIAIMPGNRATKLTAIRTVLEYTKAKPASTVNSNVTAAEAFLEALAKKE